MGYSSHSLRQKRINPLLSNWAFKEGVILTPYNLWIARVKGRSGYTTLSQHRTKEEAEQVYNEYYENKNK